MKKKIILTITILVIIAASITIYIISNKDKNCNQDAKQFKEEYESYNNKKITYNKKQYKLRSINIQEDNPMRKLNKNEIIDKLTKSTGVIIFTSPIDCTSREMVNKLLEVAQNYDCETIYYYDIDELNDKNLYNDILQVLDLKEINNGIVIFLQKGKIVEKQIGITDDYKYGTTLTEKQDNILKRKFKNGFNSISGEMCERETQC